MRGADQDRGSAAVETALLAPLLLLLIAAQFSLMRLGLADNAVQAAAYDAARAASLATSATQAQADGHTAAAGTLATQQLHCTQLDVRIDTTGFAVPVGQPAVVTATVTCVVSFADVTGATGLPGGKPVTDTAVSPLDRFRQRR